MAARRKRKSNSKSSKARTHQRRNYPEDARIRWIAEHHRKPTSVVGKGFKKIKSGMTVKQFMALDKQARSLLRIGEDSGVLKIARR